MVSRVFRCGLALLLLAVVACPSLAAPDASVRVVVELSASGVVTDAMVASTQTLLERRLNVTGTGRVTFQRAKVAGRPQLTIDVAPPLPAAELAARITRPVEVEFKEEGSNPMTGLATLDTVFTGAAINSVETRGGESGGQVVLQMTPAGKTALMVVSGQLAGQSLLVFVDGVQVASQTIAAPIRDGKLVLSHLTSQEAEVLAGLIGAGASPVTIKIVSVMPGS